MQGELEAARAEGAKQAHRISDLLAAEAAQLGAAQRKETDMNKARDRNKGLQVCRPC